jgi:hypothetical protein
MRHCDHQRANPNLLTKRRFSPRTDTGLVFPNCVGKLMGANNLCHTMNVLPLSTPECFLCTRMYVRPWPKSLTLLALRTSFARTLSQTSAAAWDASSKRHPKRCWPAAMRGRC